MARILVILVTAMAFAFSGVNVHSEELLNELVARLTAPPQIKTEAEFTAKVLVPPGQLYDPLVMLPVGTAMWINDDGGEEEGKGSRLLSIDPSGGIKVLADIGKLMPTVGYDIAPPSFGSYGGDVFSLAQPEVAEAGALKNHIVQRIEPRRDYTASVFCTLPDAGAKKIPGYGLDGRFGPPGSPFADRFFVITIYNDAIYQVTADGKCTPFVVFDGKQMSAPTMMTFSADGQAMLVAVSIGAYDITSAKAQEGAIVSISGAGKIAPQPLYRGPGRPMGMDFAPAGFGAYAGQLFFSEVGQYQIPVPQTQTMLPDGKIYRLTADGKAVLVAAGFHNPNGVRFARGKLWVSDINGDFIAGHRELPDGYIVEIEAH
jgi:hypothetical protein